MVWPWSTDHFERFIVVRWPNFFMEPKVRCHVHNSQRVVSVLASRVQFYTVYCTFCFFRMHFNIIHPFFGGLLVFSLQGFRLKFCVHFSSPSLCCMHLPLHYSFYHPVSTEVTIFKFLIVEDSSCFCYFHSRNLWKLSNIVFRSVVMFGQIS